MCEKCRPARELAANIAERMNSVELCSAEKTREFYRRQGEKRERERIIELLTRQSFFWTGDKQNLTLGKDELIALIKGEK